MSMTEQELKLDARLFAMEYMIGHTLSRILILLETTDEQLDVMEAQAKITLGQTVFPGDDPALGDMFASELQENIERLLMITRDMRAMTNKKIGR
jgi:hypothetical protein